MSELLELVKDTGADYWFFAFALVLLLVSLAALLVCRLVVRLGLGPEWRERRLASRIVTTASVMVIASGILVCIAYLRGHF